MMQWVLESFEEAQEKFIVANTPYEEFSLPVYPDLISSPTPLSGIHSALVHAQHDWVAIAACDMPFLTPVYWQALLPYCQDTSAVGVESKNGLEPLAGFYHRHLVKSIETHLQEDQKSIRIFLERSDVKILGEYSLNVPSNTFDNINSFQDFEALQENTVH